MRNIIKQANQQARQLGNLMHCILDNREDAWAKKFFLREPAPATPTKPAKQYRTTDTQLSAIIKLAKIKQHRLPSNILYWSRSFASRYIVYLYTLPFPRREYPRYASGIDQQFASQRRPQRGEYYWADGMTQPESVKSQGGQDDSQTDTSR